MAHQQPVIDSFDQLIRLPPLSVLLQFENTPVKLSVLCRYDRRQGRLWICVASDGNGAVSCALAGTPTNTVPQKIAVKASLRRTAIEITSPIAPLQAEFNNAHE